jgi:hypothetical protein
VCLNAFLIIHNFPRIGHSITEPNVERTVVESPRVLKVGELTGTVGRIY